MQRSEGNRKPGSLICLEVGVAPRAALVVSAILRFRVSAIRSRVRVFSIRHRFGPFWMSLTFAHHYPHPYLNQKTRT